MTGNQKNQKIFFKGIALLLFLDFNFFNSNKTFVLLFFSGRRLLLISVSTSIFFFSDIRLILSVHSEHITSSILPHCIKKSICWRMKPIASRWHKLPRHRFWVNTWKLRVLWFSKILRFCSDRWKENSRTFFSFLNSHVFISFSDAYYLLPRFSVFSVFLAVFTHFGDYKDQLNSILTVNVSSSLTIFSF